MQIETTEILKAKLAQIEDLITDMKHIIRESDGCPESIRSDVCDVEASVVQMERDIND